MFLEITTYMGSIWITLVAIFVKEHSLAANSVFWERNTIFLLHVTAHPKDIAPLLHYCISNYSIYRPFNKGFQNF